MVSDGLEEGEPWHRQWGPVCTPVNHPHIPSSHPSGTDHYFYSLNKCFHMLIFYNFNLMCSKNHPTISPLYIIYYYCCRTLYYHVFISKIITYVTVCRTVLRHLNEHVMMCYFCWMKKKSFKKTKLGALGLFWINNIYIVILPLFYCRYYVTFLAHLFFEKEN